MSAKALRGVAGTHQLLVAPFRAAGESRTCRGRVANVPRASRERATGRAANVPHENAAHLVFRRPGVEGGVAR
ncbi:MAG: hypothetical protein QF391_00570, partial [Myxococcota bacterium]|nr:hypothetical protein [Myxococcota bacterium]